MAKEVSSTNKKIAGSEPAPCSCSHAFQDKEYGKGIRLMNRTRSGLRCTVCGKSK